MSTAERLVKGVDFVSIPTHDIEAAVEFYKTIVGLPCSVYRKDRHFAEFETGNLTLGVLEPEKIGMSYATNPNHFALHVDDVAAARAELEGRGVVFEGEIFDTGVCHMAFFADPDGNALMLHHRYAPRTAEARARERSSGSPT